jgi:hypothetical protein
LGWLPGVCGSASSDLVFCDHQTAVMRRLKGTKAGAGHFRTKKGAWGDT